jgi:hypothetical protein
MWKVFNSWQKVTIQLAQSFVFISTLGAGGMADGNPYIQRWADDNGNIVTRAIS